MGYAKVPTKQLGSFKATILQGVTCDSSVYVGAVVRMDTGTGYYVNAQADTPANAKVVGICHAKTSPTVCDIILPGSLTDGIFLGLVLGTDYFLSAITPGALSTSFPSGSGEVILYIGRPQEATKLFFLPGTMIRRAL